MLSSIEISKAKETTPYQHRAEILHEHDDCIRIAYEWMDAQKKTKSPTRKTWAVKHLVEQWAGRYVSRSDVEVAAHMHPDIIGTYPYFNISARLTDPATARLDGIGEARTQMSYRESHDRDRNHNYKEYE